MNYMRITTISVAALFLFFSFTAFVQRMTQETHQVPVRESVVWFDSGYITHVRPDFLTLPGDTPGEKDRYAVTYVYTTSGFYTVSGILGNGSIGEPVKVSNTYLLKRGDSPTEFRILSSYTKSKAM